MGLPIHPPGVGTVPSRGSGPFGAQLPDRPGATQPACARVATPLSPQQVARFWSYVDRSGGCHACWPWRRSLDTTGYGQFAAGGRVHKAHRIAYTIAFGPIPPGHEVKQDCEDRACTNPAHLRLVPPAESRARLAARHGGRTHCLHGHRYDAANTYYWNGTRRCRLCQRMRARAGYHRRKADPGATDNGVERATGVE